jgi:hypothetical protein
MVISFSRFSSKNRRQMPCGSKQKMRGQYREPFKTLLSLEGTTAIAIVQILWVIDVHQNILLRTRNA